VNASRLLLIAAIAACISLTLLPTAACADEVSYSDSVPLGSTNWTDSVTVPKFNEVDCTLNEVCFTLEGHVEGTAKFESEDASPTTVTMNLQATIELQRPDSSPLATVIPLVETSDDVTAFDGIIDFAGTSGKTYSDLSGDKTENDCTTDPADLALFTGSGDITLPAEAIGSSYGSGAGNLWLQFSTSASVAVTVTYYYECVSAVENSTWSSIKALYR